MTPWDCRPAIVGRATAATLFCFHATGAAFSLSLEESDASFRQIDLFDSCAHGCLVADRWRASVQWLRLSRWSGYRGPNGRCVGWSDIGRTCGDPPSTRCTPEGPNAGAEEAAKLGAKAIEAGKPKPGGPK